MSANDKKESMIIEGDTIKVTEPVKVVTNH